MRQRIGLSGIHAVRATGFSLFLQFQTGICFVSGGGVVVAGCGLQCESTLILQYYIRTINRRLNLCVCIARLRAYYFKEYHINNTFFFAAATVAVATALSSKPVTGLCVCVRMLGYNIIYSDVDLFFSPAFCLNIILSIIKQRLL